MFSFLMIPLQNFDIDMRYKHAGLLMCLIFTAIKYILVKRNLLNALPHMAVKSLHPIFPNPQPKLPDSSFYKSPLGKYQSRFYISTLPHLLIWTKSSVKVSIFEIPV